MTGTFLRWIAAAGVVAQITTAVAAQVADPLTLRAWKFDATTGSYYVEAKVDGEYKRLLFTPATYIAPRITATISRQAHEFVFGYEIANDSQSKQSILSCRFIVAFPASVVASPVGWTPMTTPERNRIAWVKLTPPGVNPSESMRDFIMRAQGLPGVSHAECLGRSPVAEVEDWMSKEARRELDLLLDRNFVTVPIIAPSIAAHAQEPVATIFARIRAHYAAHLDKLGPDYSQRITPRLIAVEGDLRRRRLSAASAAIEKLVLTLPTGGTAWDTQVLSSLRACLEYVKNRLEARDGK